MTKFEKIKKNLESLQIEIEEDLKKPSVFSSRTKRDSVITQDHTGRKKAAKFLKFSDYTQKIHSTETADI